MSANLAMLRPSRPRTWSAHEISLLGKVSDREVRRLTGRTLDAIRVHRHKLGISRAKSPALTAVEESQVQHEYSTGSNQYELAAKYSVDQSTVSRVCNRWYRKQQRDGVNLKAETLSALATVWRESCATGTQKFFGIETEPVGMVYRITWRDLQTKRRGVLCTVANWDDFNAIASAVWERIVQLRGRQKSFEFLRESA
jgi:hypothetical protein